MEQSHQVSPLFVVLLFILRCLVPLGILFGISYLLRRLGLIASPPPPPPGWNNENSETSHYSPHPPSSGGGLAYVP